MNSLNAKYAVIDTETTGLTKNSNVLTVSIIISNDRFEFVDSLHLSIKYPFYTIYIAALHINKIDLIQHDKNAISQHNAKIQIKEFLDKYFKNNKGKLIGHNILFDLDKLENNLIVDRELLFIYFDDIIDTYTISKKLKKNNTISKNQSLSLEKLCYYFDLNNNVIKLELEKKLNKNTNENLNFHNSLYDTLMTLLLYRELTFLI